jgi:REP element-mobilizing transposase RayT
MQLSLYGRITDTTWRRLMDRANGVTLDAWGVMPNHVHAIIVLTGDPEPDRRGEASSVASRTSKRKVRAEPRGPERDEPHHASSLHPGNPGIPETPRLVPGTLGAIVGNAKSVSTRTINKVRKTPGTPVWQRNYYEHIIRDETALARIRTYIAENPARWAEDCYFKEDPTSS